LKTKSKDRLNAAFRVSYPTASFGNNHQVKPFGSFKEEFEVDDQVFEENFLVVSSDFLDVQVVIGAEFCNNAEITINRDGIKIQSQEKHAESELGALMKINVESAENLKVSFDESATTEKKRKVYDLIKNYNPTSTKTTKVLMRIVLKDDTPVHSRPRRFAFSERCIIDDQIEQWLKDGIIEHSESEYSSPVVLVKKRDNTLRLCIDYRRINKVIVRDMFPLPLIED